MTSPPAPLQVLISSPLFHFSVSAIVHMYCLLVDNA
ncbi:unnamed protein product [Arabidopsis thaliana]|uniref:Transmembrane protein n=2 Tax=Arabidopsis thaliana TaxID=3702 RepID=A0A654F935_ARATH|nr:uncharacterized protein AT3G17261 [Arabidopsis thaliana]AEE75929.1 transmembrane protein [Arabidopsis thaliana]CAA0382727.1 unnamed protein product [Arabidopsis thaliana]VYS57670.1 unnamed protein product [Arabidopsis thaliana]|eukprot:NP_001118649.1 transmembrane protein [Arabidopsis thaliana]